MRRAITSLLIVVTGVLATACGPEVIYEHTVGTGTGGADASWSYADSMVHEFEIPNTSQPYNLDVLVEHATTFPYENFYLKIHTTPPNGKRTTERVSLQLSGNYGEWYGDCSGASCELPISLLDRTRFDRSGRYQITLEQNSRDSLLPGILSIGIRLSESEVE